MKKKLFAAFLFIVQCTFSQESVAPKISITDSLFLELANLQVKETSFYSKGMFPTKRGRLKHVDDNNIFFSALIAQSIQYSSKDLSIPLKKSADTLSQLVKSNYIHYLNTSGPITYNFWKTNPPEFFPNANPFFQSQHFRIPDDADCTSLIYLTDDSLDKNALKLKEKLVTHANQSSKKIKNTFRRYRQYKAYSTWFGVKMPIEFDMCVQSNILLYIYKHELPINEYDEETLKLLRSQILSGDYKKYAFYLSPSYKKFSIILYHLARLLENNTIPILEECRAVIKKDIERELINATEFMEKVVLSSSLIRMNGTPPPFSITADANKSLENYVFFRANLFSSYARPSLRFISKTKLFDCDFYCKAYSLSLLLELQSLRANEKTE